MFQLTHLVQDGHLVQHMEHVHQAARGGQEDADVSLDVVGNTCRACRT